MMRPLARIFKFISIKVEKGKDIPYSGKKFVLILILLFLVLLIIMTLILLVRAGYI